MAEMLDAVLRHLEALVSFDTRNPPRLIGTGGIFDYIRAQLPDFKIEVVDHGEGAVSLFAVRGKPTRVFNVHLDTVPSSEAWTADPHVMRRFEDRVVGLGVCDIKGAAAGLVGRGGAQRRVQSQVARRVLRRSAGDIAATLAVGARQTAAAHRAARQVIKVGRQAAGVELRPRRDSALPLGGR